MIRGSSHGNIQRTVSETVFSDEGHSLIKVVFHQGSHCIQGDSEEIVGHHVPKTEGQEMPCGRIMITSGKWYTKTMEIMKEDKSVTLKSTPPEM